MKRVVLLLISICLSTTFLWAEVETEAKTPRESFKGKTEVFLSVDKTLSSLTTVSSQDSSGKTITVSENSGSDGWCLSFEYYYYVSGDENSGNGIGLGINRNFVDGLNSTNIYFVYNGMFALAPSDLYSKTYFVLNTGLGYGHINEEIKDDVLTSQLSGTLYYKLNIGIDFDGFNIYIGYRYNLITTENKYRSYMYSYNYNATIMYHYFVAGIGFRI
ncbi:MAG: hypothetical protein LBD46_05195 [Endomicrobium sp.]|jgi:hypothetical protein|nr:hypothetical protein [Endomicrobium sp.]